MSIAAAQSASDRPFARIVGIALACSLPRLAFLWHSGPLPATGFNWQLSDGLLRDGTLTYGGQPTGAFEPLYPLFLAVARWATRDSVWLVAVAQILVASAGAVLLDRLVQQMSGRRSSGTAAALIYAGYPYLIRQSVAWLEVTLVSTLLLAAWLAWAKRQWLVCAGWLALVTLARAMVLPVGIIGVALMFRRAPRRQAVAVALLFVGLLAPWAIRNVRLEGTVLPSRNGEDLYAGNNVYAFGMIPRWDLDLLHEPNAEIVQKAAGRPLSPAALNGEYIRRALAFMAEDPWRTLRVKAANIAFFFSPRIVPFEPAGDDTTIELLPDGTVRIDRARQRGFAPELTHAVVYTLVLIIGVIGWYQRRDRWREDALLLASVAVFALAAAVYFPTTRIRAPIDPVLMAYTGCAVGAFRRRRSG